MTEHLTYVCKLTYNRSAERPCNTTSSHSTNTRYSIWKSILGMGQSVIWWDVKLMISFYYQNANICPKLERVPRQIYEKPLKNHPWEVAKNIVWKHIPLQWNAKRRRKRSRKILNNYSSSPNGQKYRDKITLTSKTRFSRHCFWFSKPALFATSGL